MRAAASGNEEEQDARLEITVLSEERVDRIMDGLDVLASRGLLGTDEAAELIARIQRLAPDRAGDAERVNAAAE